MVGRVFSAVVATVVGLAAAPAARADGGVVRISQSAGPFEVTVFTSPTPFRAGPVDVSVMVTDRAGGEPVLDAEVSVLLAPRDGGSSIRVAATRAKATNKLLYAALLDLPRSGRWRLTVGVRRDRSTGAAEVTTGLWAAPALPPLLSYWFYLALPPIVVVLFLSGQWLGGGAAVDTARR